MRQWQDDPYTVTAQTIATACDPVAGNRVRKSPLSGFPYATDHVIDADGVSLWAAAVGIITGIPALWIATLGSRPVDIHPPVGPTVFMGGSGPVVCIVGRSRLIDDGSAVKYRRYRR